MIDLKTYPFVEKIFGKTLWGYTDVYRTINFRAGYGLHADTYFSSLREQISRRLRCEKVFLSRPISLHGLCSSDLPRESSRHRSLFTFPKNKTVPHGLPEHGVPVNSGR